MPGLEEALAREFGLPLPVQQWLDSDDSLHEETLRAKIAGILDDAGTAEFRRVAYDLERTQALMRKVDLPQRLVERLSWGR